MSRIMVALSADRVFVVKHHQTAAYWLVFDSRGALHLPVIEDVGQGADDVLAAFLEGKS